MRSYGLLPCMAMRPHGPSQINCKRGTWKKEQGTGKRQVNVTVPT